MESQVVTTAFLLTLFAGLSTGIGSLISLIAKRTNTNFLSIALGLSAGVMIYVSFMEMLPSSLNMLTETFGERANLYTFLALFGGIAFIALIDLLVPKSSNPHEMHGVEEMKRDTQRLRHTGIITALTIGIHNFPEGIATFMTAVNSLEVAIDHRSHSHPQYSGRDRSGRAHLSRHGKQKKNILAFLLVGAG